MASKKRKVIEDLMPSKKNGKPKDFTSYDTPKVKKTLEDMRKPPSKKSVDATGTPVKKKTTSRPKTTVTTPPVKKGKMDKIAKGMAITSPLWLGPPAYVAVKEAMRKKSHKVKSGDTLSQIAKKHGTTLKALLAANPQIKDANKIRVGQKIKMSRPVKGRKSVYQGMSKSAMAEMAKKKKKVVKKAGGGMTRVGLSPAEMARAGTMSEADRLRYMKKGGKVGKKEQGYKARKDESIAMRVKKKRTKKQLKASRSESYGKWGKGKGKGKINRSGDKLVAASYG